MAGPLGAGVAVGFGVAEAFGDGLAFFTDFVPMCNVAISNLWFPVFVQVPVAKEPTVIALNSPLHPSFVGLAFSPT